MLEKEESSFFQRVLPVKTLENLSISIPTWGNMLLIGIGFWMVTVMYRFSNPTWTARFSLSQGLIEQRSGAWHSFPQTTQLLLDRQSFVTRMIPSREGPLMRATVPQYCLSMRRGATQRGNYQAHFSFVEFRSRWVNRYGHITSPQYPFPTFRCTMYPLFQPTDRVRVSRNLSSVSEPLPTSKHGKR